MPLADRLRPLPVVGTAVRVQERYRTLAADQSAASMGFFAFLAMFPLVLIAAAVAGAVVADDPDQQRRLVVALLDAVPGITAALGGGADGGASQLATLVDTVTRRAGTVGLVGGVLLLPPRLRVVEAATTATLRIFAVDGEPTGVRRRRRGLAALLALAAVAWTGLEVVGATWVTGQVGRTNELYGVFEGVVALLLFYLAGRIYVHGAVLSTVAGDGDGDVAPSGGLPPAPLPEVGRGTARFPRDPERPRIVAGPGEPSPVVTPATRARLDAAEERRPRGADVRGALAFVIAVGAVGGLVRYLRPWDAD
jgi:uncharacterized BrkB/YihY/UPF0761 family membrane protein